MPPVVIAAGIGAAAGIGGGLLSASAQKKAAGKASDSAERTAAANNALQLQVRNDNKATLSPYVTRGNEAGSAINALLGISGTSTTGGSAASGVDWNAYMADPLNADAVADRAANQPGVGVEDYARQHYIDDGSRRSLAPYTRQMSPDDPRSIEGVTTNAGNSANNAFQNYLNSAGYQFQMDQGNKAINQGYAARGSLQSGAALKALQANGQNTATGFFNNYLGLLSNQQGVGLSGANALAGVGTNYANTVSANNNAAGTAQQNAYLAQGNANSQLYGNIAGGISGVANAYASSYGKRP